MEVARLAYVTEAFPLAEGEGEALLGAEVVCSVDLGKEEEVERMKALLRRHLDPNQVLRIHRAVAPYLRAVQRIRPTLSRCWYFGFARCCPCCGARLRSFRPFGLAPRPEARCPVCLSLERHRLVYLYMKQRTDLFSGSRNRLMLHVAPEPQLSRLFQKVESLRYISGDLGDLGIVSMDVTAIPFPDEVFDAVYCSHVLEHVVDDRRAMRELCRVMKPNGWAILQVPITAPSTVEDPSVVEASERLRLYGQEDHVRRYGLDYEDRLRESGFSVTGETFARSLGAEQAIFFGITPDETIFLCRKTPTHESKDRLAHR